MYLTGSTNYDTHAEALARFQQCRTPVALRLMEDGTATLNWLQKMELHRDQPEFQLTGCKCNFNTGENQR